MTTPAPGPRPRVPDAAVRPATVALAAIVLAAAAVRVAGITFGLPAVYNPDEVAIMSRALAFAKGDLNPHNFLYPTFFFYVLFGWLGASFVAGRAIGFYASLADFQNRFFTDPSGIYLAGRLLGVTCGVLTVIAVYQFGRRAFSRDVGLIAALFLAVAPLHVRDSHYVKHDVPVTLAIVVAFVLIWNVWPSVVASALPGPSGVEGSRTVRPGAAANTPAPLRHGLGVASVAAAAGASGVALSTHYYAVFLALPLAYSTWLRVRFDGLAAVVRTWVLAAAICGAVFFALSPFILVEPSTAWRDIVANRQIVVDRAARDAGGVFASAPQYATMFFRDAMGWPIALLAGAGAVGLLISAPALGVLVVAFPAAFVAFISNTVPASRYLNPVLPFAAVLAALAVWRLGQLARPPWRGSVTAGLAIVVAVPALAASVRADRLFRQADTRTLAQRFIESSVPGGSTVLLQPYSVPLTQSRDSLVESLRHTLGDERRASTRFALRLQAQPSGPAYRLIFLGDGGLDADKIYVSYSQLGGAAGLSALRGHGVRWAVVKRYNRPDSATLPFLDALSREARQVAAFSPYREGAAATRIEPFLHNTDTPIDPAIERPGPTIEIWELRY